MKSSIKSALFAFLLLFGATIFGKETNYLLPDLQMVWSRALFSDVNAVGLLGEAGNKNFRLSGTFGSYITPNQRAKVTVEGLTQKLHFDEFENRKSTWVYQIAAGGEYEFLLNRGILRGLDIGAAYSHAFFNHGGHSSAGLHQRIADSDGLYLSVGPVLAITCTTLLFARYDYDFVKFYRLYNDNRFAKGSGVSLELIQSLPAHFTLSLDTELTPPYNYYGGLLSWCWPRYNVATGLYANYTDGKVGVPSVMTGGLRLDFTLGRCTRRCDPCGPCKPVIAAWVADPSVYIPTVLAIADSERSAAEAVTCLTPVVVASPALANGTTGSALTIDTATHFTGTGITSYVLSGALPAGLSFNSTTGQISGTPTATGTTTVSVSAVNACGMSLPFDLIININCILPTTTNCPTTAFFTAGIANSFSIASSFTGPGITSYTLTGTLPAGLSFNGATGVVSGTATSTGTTTVSISANNSCGSSAPCSLTITVVCRPPSANACFIQPTSATEGQPYSLATAGNFNIAGCSTAFYSITCGALPTGLTINSSTGLISGTVANGTGGVYNFTVTVSTSGGSASIVIQLRVV